MSGTEEDAIAKILIAKKLQNWTTRDQIRAIQSLLLSARIDELDSLLGPVDSLMTTSVDELTIVKRMAKLKGLLHPVAALGGKSDQGKSSNISDSEQPMPDYADNRNVEKEN